MTNKYEQVFLDDWHLHNSKFCPDKQYRKVGFTIPNYIEHGLSPDVVEERLRSIVGNKYWCFSEEVGLETGLPHIQGFLYCENPKKGSRLMNLFDKKAHWDPKNGSQQANRDYVLKEGKWADHEKAKTKIEGTFRESGEMLPERQPAKSSQEQLLYYIEDGMTAYEIIKADPKAYMYRVKNITELRQLHLMNLYGKERRDVRVTFVTGPTRSGKTTSVVEKYGTSQCRIANYRNGNPYFDDYDGHDVLVFDEFNSQIPLEQMNDLLDGIAGTTLVARYADRVACYTEVYIISNLQLYELYVSDQMCHPGTWQAFLARITEVRKFSADGVYETTTPVEMGLIDDKVAKSEFYRKSHGLD